MNFLWHPVTEQPSNWLMTTHSIILWLKMTGPTGNRGDAVQILTYGLLRHSLSPSPTPHSVALKHTNTYSRALRLSEHDLAWASLSLRQPQSVEKRRQRVKFSWQSQSGQSRGRSKEIDGGRKPDVFKKGKEFKDKIFIKVRLLETVELKKTKSTAHSKWSEWAIWGWTN